MVTTNQKSITDTHKKKESKHKTKVVMNSQGKRGEKRQKKTKMNYKMTYLKWTKWRGRNTPKLFLWSQHHPDNQTKIPQKRKLQANMTDESLFFTRFYFLQGCACDSKYQCHLPHLHMYKLYSSLKAKINDIFSMKSPPVFLVWSTLSFLWTSTVCVCTSLAFFTIYNKVLCNCYIFYIL